MQITNEQEFRINYENFYLAYNKQQDIWYAKHNDEDKYDDVVIVDIPYEKPIELFDGFILDIQEFKEIEGIKNTVI